MTPRLEALKAAAKTAVLANTGYGRNETDAYAQGMIDALTLVARLPIDEEDMRDFAAKAARL